jgi:hypothetical protein
LPLARLLHRHARARERVDVALQGVLRHAEPERELSEPERLRRAREEPQLERVLRIVEDLSRLGGGSRKRRWKLAGRGDGLAKLSALLDVSHYLALRVAMGEAGALAQDSSLYAALEDLAGKIEKAVGKKGRSQLAAIERCFLAWDKHAYRSAGREHLWPLVRAIEERRICRVAYRAVSTGGTLREYEVLPLRLFVHDRALYLVCKFEGTAGSGR